MTSGFTSRSLFRELDGRTFSTYRDLERQIREIFSSHIESFPGQYSPDRLLEFGERMKWIVRVGEEYEIHYPKTARRAKRLA